jgi:hypothetical protein
MPLDQTSWSAVKFTKVVTQGGSIDFGTSPVYNMIYSSTSTSLTASSVLELNSRDFTVHSLIVKWTRAGNAYTISINFDIENPSSGVNKYEITLPTISNIPSLVAGHFVASHTVNPDDYDLRQAIIYNSKVRIGNSNRVVTSSGTYDYAFQANRRFVGTINFNYAI